MINVGSRDASRRSRDDGYVLAVVLGLGARHDHPGRDLAQRDAPAASRSPTQRGGLERRARRRLRRRRGLQEPRRERHGLLALRQPGGTVQRRQHGTSALPTGSSANAAFNVDGRRRLGHGAGSDDLDPRGRRDTAYFRYEVDNSHFASTGVLRIRSTGRVGDVTRSVIADLKQNGFNDYVYFTKFEIQDPAHQRRQALRCGNYKWLRPTSCTDIQFGASDILRGKVHSNDRLLICGSRLRGLRHDREPDQPALRDPDRIGLRRRHLPRRTTRPDGDRSRCRDRTPRCARRPATTCRFRCRAPAVSTPARRPSRSTTTAR